MKLLFISKSDEFKEKLIYHFSPLGFDIQHSREPMELINNIENFDFDVILFDANDFPRHWKPLVKVLREYKSKEKAVVILTNSNGFPFEEASKAIFLEINGLIANNLNSKQIIYRLEEILRRYKDIPDNRKFARLLITDTDDIGFLLTHPRRLELVFGEILDISIQGLNFMPYNTETVEGIFPGDVISNATLRLEKNLLNINCSVVRNKGTMGLLFDNFVEEEHHILFEFLMNKPERALNTRLIGK